MSEGTKVKARKVTPLRVFVGLLCLATAYPIADFLWIFISFEIELSTREKEARRMTPEAATQLIEDAKRFAALHANDHEYFNFGEIELQRLRLPDSIKKLEPRRIVGQKDHIVISLLFMMDTGGELAVSKDEEGAWILEGQFGEREPSFRIYPK